ncbi:MAG: hypothetical protein ACK2T7_02460 [Anaerolineales bacterium]
MTRRQNLLLTLTIVLLLALACSTTPPEMESIPDPESLSTIVAATAAAIMAENVPSTPTPGPLPTNTPDPYSIYAPDPLPVNYTGLIFEEGECYNLDSYQPVAGNDTERDICMHTFGLLEPENGGRISGYATQDPPSKGYCNTPDLLPDPVAVQTDLYLCIQTGRGLIGFFVAREYQMDLNRVIFDLYLFP